MKKKHDYFFFLNDGAYHIISYQDAKRLVRCYKSRRKTVEWVGPVLVLRLCTIYLRLFYDCSPIYPRFFSKRRDADFKLFAYTKAKLFPSVPTPVNNMQQLRQMADETIALRTLTPQRAYASSSPSTTSSLSSDLFFSAIVGFLLALVLAAILHLTAYYKFF